mmetsp:Transcript_32957/g.51093  ORF Transcript_32957/g.51093 Transcript_32957/m.51093 type:complete len:730 (-) Transcript_32957:72-2261(-)
MPVYLCQPGAGSSEPWRHGIQVYAAPFAMDEASLSDSGRDAFVLPASTMEATNWSSNDRETSSERPDPARTTQSANTPSIPQQRNASGLPIRRVRHAEVVLVDDTCVAFDRYWLRLRWPGHKGSFAGYIALGKVGQPTWHKELSDAPQEIKVVSENEVDDSSRPDESYVAVETSRREREEERVVTDEIDNDDPTRDDEPQDNASTLSSEPFESTSTLTCLRTGLAFPSSVAMKLLAVYDDGLSPPVTSAPLPSEPVFCRICREGLHDDADQEQPSPAMENEADDGDRGQSTSPSTSLHTPGDTDLQTQGGGIEGQPRTASVPKGPVLPHPTYHSNQHAAENPILAPCECSGSMAFVHYMCVEQWRCRSRHPEARQGLQCETCNQPYMLPPPSARPASEMQVENEDWLEAMPPHVMAALRQPHIWWQIGAAIVRRRWLRPLAPVVMSPIVALYCRARRLLKKKGVARRRWACSLCRRRARWKCVRCLRSYYCSRQCQNVSWHIVHKHVCYKPSRWTSSLVVYGCLTLALFPGILRDPLMYDLGLGLVPASFYVMAILGGGVATLLKKSAGVDLRGRAFEMTIILLTLWLALVCWGLVGAFFGEPAKCHGSFGSYDIISEDEQPRLLGVFRKVVMKPAEKWFLMWDRLSLNSGPWLRRALCTPQEEGCFEHLHKANADFFFQEYGGGKCASDLSLVTGLFMVAGFVAVGNHVWKRRERQRRAARRPRPHQD